MTAFEHVIYLLSRTSPSAPSRAYVTLRGPIIPERGCAASPSEV